MYGVFIPDIVGGVAHEGEHIIVCTYVKVKLFFQLSLKQANQI